MTEQETRDACSVKTEAPVEELMTDDAASEEEIQAARDEAWRTKRADESGNVTSLDPFVYFIYKLLIDEVTSGALERIVREIEEIFEEMAAKVVENNKSQSVIFTNGFVASHAKAVVSRLLASQQALVFKTLGMSTAKLNAESAEAGENALAVLTSLFSPKPSTEGKDKKPE